MNTQERVNAYQKISQAILANVNKVIVGKERVIQRLLIALLSGGHVLIEDVPGIGKTTMVHALARALQLDFHRIQFTPDLMPSDVTGFNLYNPKDGEFVFQEGAVMTQILLADEINRSSPRTQSALLEAMQEGQVTVDNTTYPLPTPFMVLATQNPIEHVGTYPLPEAQLDRFMMRISLGYPSIEEEMDIVSLNSDQLLREEVQAAASVEELMWMREQAQSVLISDEVKRYIVDLCRATREHPLIDLGASPRAAQMLLSACRSLALMNGRDYVIPDDVQELIGDVLAHRLILKPSTRGKGMRSDDLLQEILKNTAVPR
ncbi:MAG: MoxR family ATPase [Ndongobacter sp.]|nr:MoxR family ATPase [Ndongobacter sp.]